MEASVLTPKVLLQQKDEKKDREETTTKTTTTTTTTTFRIRVKVIDEKTGNDGRNAQRDHQVKLLQANLSNRNFILRLSS